jgi:hypothetical protein
VIIDDPYWLKTTNNCYVAQKALYSKPDITYLDNCGPIPFLEVLFHTNSTDPAPEPVDPDPPSPTLQTRNPLPIPADQNAHYLINVTVGEDYAFCRTCPLSTCSTVKRYPFNSEVWLQCLVDSNGTWWSETTDFCYVKNSDFWESPEGDCKFDCVFLDEFRGGDCEGGREKADLWTDYRNPLCKYFESPDHN